ncbi:hypothetical protein HNV08_10490 [Winogradskyella eckloniae]|uniref:hypothetical protein n=1 Tax=Winogradskyella eckloniae TaxID=1089306 RepID=UPI0015672A16|nr:hypothetical protein [Winogradskyella eckloniae]NRD20475.1 hypothetical protein [Winogradskyella eckloniae]
MFALRPIYFVGNVLYYQLNIDYIIETYCINKDQPELQCNGKCHLAKQLSAVDNTDDEGQAIISLFDSFFPVFTGTFITIDIKNFKLYYNKQKIGAYSQNYAYHFEYVHFKPPII